MRQRRMRTDEDSTNRAGRDLCQNLGRQSRWQSSGAKGGNRHSRGEGEHERQRGWKPEGACSQSVSWEMFVSEKHRYRPRDSVEIAPPTIRCLGGTSTVVMGFGLPIGAVSQKAGRAISLPFLRISGVFLLLRPVVLAVWAADYGPGVVVNWAFRSSWVAFIR